MNNPVREWSEAQRMPKDLRHQLRKGAHAIGPVAEELCGMIYTLHLKTAIPDLCACTIWPFTDMLPSPHEHHRLTETSPVNACCPSSDAAGLQAHTDCW